MTINVLPTTGDGMQNPRADTRDRTYGRGLDRSSAPGLETVFGTDAPGNTPAVAEFPRMRGRLEGCSDTWLDLVRPK
jgi:hypothetical protein